MTYRIKAEYLDRWGDDATKDTVLTEDDLNMILRGWEKDFADVADQLIPEHFDQAVALMDDEIREAVHADLAPCSEALFAWEYCRRHEQKYGKPFTV